MIKQRLRLPRAPCLAAGIVILTAAMLAGCASDNGDEGVVSAGGTATSGPAADREQKLEQYRDCLERHGIPLLDYPTGEGLPQIDKGRTSTEKLSAAFEECRAYLPTGGDIVRLPQTDIEAWRRYAACIRENGVADYPDPDPRGGEQRVGEELGRRLKDDPKLPAALEACRSALPSGPDGKGTVGG